MKEKRICIFGGSGFLGHALIERLALVGRRNIVIVGRNEGALVATKARFPFVEVIPGDIADPWVVRKAMSRAWEVYHLAAMKHVGLAETEVRACITSNVIGTSNIMEASLEFIPEVLVFISTDKAAQPSGVYGCSKKIGEQLVAEAQRINPETRYRVLRYGNVWGSTGSIATKWRPLIERGEEVTLTDPDASRFFWTVTEAVDLIFQAVNTTIGGCDPIVPKMKAVKMGVVLEACIEHFMQSSGNGRARSEVNIIGLQPGENKTETTDGVIFSDQVEQFTKAEFIKKFLS